MLVSVCIATFHRPEGLARLLEGLDSQVLDHDVEIVVVDNDAEASARTVADELGRSLKWPVTYVVEPNQGISYARNAGVAQISLESDFVAFIDDDEVPDNDWLAQLLAVQKREDADVVHGDVVPFYMEGVPEWIAKGEYFVEAPFLEATSGTNRLNTAATNCTLVRASIFADHNPPFDLAFGQTGGEDDFFFRSLYAEGKVIVHAPKAKVTEWIPAHRANARWLMKSAYRKGNTFTLTHLKLNPSIAARLSRISKAVGRIGQGSVQVPVHLVKRDGLWLAGAQNIALGLGTLAGVFGKSFYKAYSKPRRL